MGLQGTRCGARETEAGAPADHQTSARRSKRGCRLQRSDEVAPFALPDGYTSKSSPPRRAGIRVFGQCNLPRHALSSRLRLPRAHYYYITRIECMANVCAALQTRAHDDPFTNSAVQYSQPGSISRSSGSCTECRPRSYRLCTQAAFLLFQPVSKRLTRKRRRPADRSPSRRRPPPSPARRDVDPFKVMATLPQPAATRYADLPTGPETSLYRLNIPAPPRGEPSCPKTLTPSKSLSSSKASHSSAHLHTGHLLISEQFLASARSFLVAIHGRAASRHRVIYRQRLTGSAACIRGIPKNRDYLYKLRSLC